MDTIIKILKENQLYDDKSKEVYVNKKQDFLNNYKINKSSKNKIPNTIKRNNDGFLILDNEPYIISNLKENGHNDKFWIILSNGSRILLKDVTDDEIQNELLFKYLCKWLDIPCANYDVCLFGSEKYLISPSFLGINEYLFDYYNLNGKYHIKIDELLKDASYIDQDSFVRKTLIVDMLTQNQDRFPRNFKVIKNPKQIRICPLFDNGILEINNEKLLFKIYPEINYSISDDDIACYLMQDNKFKQWCLNKIISRQIPNLRKQIYEDKKIYIDDEVFDSFNKSVYDGKALILDNFKNN